MKRISIISALLLAVLMAGCAAAAARSLDYYLSQFNRRSCSSPVSSEMMPSSETVG